LAVCSITRVALSGFFVLTGSIQMEGGQKTTVRRLKERLGEKHTAIHDRVVTEDRRRAVVIVTDYMRKVRNNRLIKTPFGSLFASDSAGFLKLLMEKANKDVTTFNISSPTCKIWNCMVWEALSDKRRECLSYWFKNNSHSKKAKAILSSILHLTQSDSDR
jgi:hypothetical protein